MATVEREKDFQEVADEYGRGVVAGMREELDALEHARDCNGEAVCSVCDGLGEFPEGDCGHCNGQGDVACKAGKDSEEPDAWHDEDRARERIEESPLSAEVRSDWHAPYEAPGDPVEFRILLGTGGPASRIIGELDEYGQPTSAEFQYQDWFKPWTTARLSREEEATLLEWAQVFNFEVSR